MSNGSFSQQPSSNGARRLFFPEVEEIFPSLNSPPRDDNDSLFEDDPWSPSSLTLPPFNSFNNFDENEQLPHLNDPLFNSGLPWSQNPNPFAQLSSRSSDNDQQPHQEPPPSNQQARPPRPQSQYLIPDSDSPDPFDSFFDFQDTPPRDIMPPRRTNNNSRTMSTRSSVVDLTTSSPPRTAPASRKRKAETPDVGRAVKLARPGSARSQGSHDLSKVAVVDLVDVENEAEYEALKAKEQEESIKAQNQADAVKPVKLAEFQCIICMDNPTDLTVTHCGHLFCSECLHQALHAGDKKCCPVCRSVISLPRNAGSKQPRNGVFVLEMKLMTANRKGKQPATVR